jgi:alkyl hydroperoxide reductase subunit AhpC
LRQAESELQRHDAAVAVVTFEAGPLAMAYVRETHLTWPLLVDADRRLYRAYGMERGSTWNVMGPASVWAYTKLMARGRMPKKPQGDPCQLGGDVIVDPAGVVRLHHVGSGPADRPSVAELLRVMA